MKIDLGSKQDSDGKQVLVITEIVSTRSVNSLKPSKRSFAIIPAACLAEIFLAKSFKSTKQPAL